MANTRPTNDEVIAKLLTTFDGLDQQRAAGLAELKTVQTVRNAAATREQQRLTQKYGADHPRVASVSARVAFNQKFATNLNSEIERSKITAPEYDINSWLVHGRVLDMNGAPKAGITLSLSDAKGTWVRALGHTCSDANGYYALKYTSKPGAALPVPVTQPLFLTATDSEFKLLQRDTQALYLKIGQIDVRQMVLAAPAGTCTPPVPASGSGGTDELPPDAWLVRGRVLYDDNQPGAGLTISLYDKDLLFDDKLGTTQTDATGNFRILYRTEAFRDLFETNPDLYLKVLDRNGRTLYTSRKAVRSAAGRVEEFQITLKRKAGDAKK
jgi:hypothetical protein